MTDEWVYFTAGGGRWHDRADCEALAQGQQEAATKGLTNHPIQRVPRARVGNRTPCGWCVMSDVPDGPLPPHSPVDDLLTETPYERVFADHVLRPLAELSAWKIQSQQSININGRTYRPDFLLVSPPLRVAIEIDGRDKGPGSADHDAWTRRQTDLVNAGWEMLRFTNRQVMQEQEYCRRQIAVAVARLQERAQRPPPPSAAASSAAATSTTTTSSRAPALLGVAAVGVIAAVAAVIWLSNTGEDSTQTPADGDRYPCASTALVKGNVSQSGEKIYHQPGDDFYNRTQAEQCFPDSAAAEAAGFRAARR